MRPNDNHYTNVNVYDDIVTESQSVHRPQLFILSTEQERRGKGTPARR